MSSRAKSRNLTKAEDVTQVGEILRSESDWHIAQDDNAGVLVAADELRADACQSSLRRGSVDPSFGDIEKSYRRVVESDGVRR
jgi:hypothetical protein